MVLCTVYSPLTADICCEYNHDLSSLGKTQFVLGGSAHVPFCGHRFEVDRSLACGFGFFFPALVFLMGLPLTSKTERSSLSSPQKVGGMVR